MYIVWQHMNRRMRGIYRYMGTGKEQERNPRVEKTCLNGSSREIQGKESEKTSSQQEGKCLKWNKIKFFRPKKSLSSAELNRVFWSQFPSSLLSACGLHEPFATDDSENPLLCSGCKGWAQQCLATRSWDLLCVCYSTTYPSSAEHFESYSLLTCLI